VSLEVHMTVLRKYMIKSSGVQVLKLCRDFEKSLASAALAKKAGIAHLHADRLVNLS